MNKPDSPSPAFTRVPILKESVSSSGRHFFSVLLSASLCFFHFSFSLSFSFSVSLCVWKWKKISGDSPSFFHGSGTGIANRSIGFEVLIPFPNFLYLMFRLLGFMFGRGKHKQWTGMDWSWNYFKHDWKNFTSHRCNLPLTTSEMVCFFVYFNLLYLVIIIKTISF